MKLSGPDVVPKRRFGQASQDSLEVLVRLFLESVDGVSTIKEISEKLGLDIGLAQRIVLCLIQKEFLWNPEIEKRIAKPQRTSVLVTGLAEARRTKNLGSARRPAPRPADPVGRLLPPSVRSTIQQRWKREHADKALKALLSKSHIPPDSELLRDNWENRDVHRNLNTEKSPDPDLWSGDTESRKQLAHLNQKERRVPNGKFLDDDNESLENKDDLPSPMPNH